MFSQFYDALYELSERPESTEMRVNLQQNAITLAETFNYYAMRLQEQQATLNETVRITADEINSLASKISSLNKQIYGYELTGATANDLRDQRDVLLDELAGLVAVNTEETPDGKLIISVGSGETEHVLVRHNEVHQMTVIEDGELLDGNPKYTVVWKDMNTGLATYAEVDMQKGALRGYLDIRDGGNNENIGIPYVYNKLNDIVRKLARDMNEIHQQGWTFPATDGAESKTGMDFFHVPAVELLTDSDGRPVYDRNGDEIYIDPKTGDQVYPYDENGNFDPYALIDITNFRLSDAIMSDVFNIATSSEKVELDADNNQKGNNENILAMCGIITKTDEAGNPDNVDSFYKSLLNDISIAMDTIHNNYKSQTVMLNHLDNQRSSISDVSLDEEMTNVVRFGHAYNAASRVISAIDEELDKLINGTGRVGL